MHGIDTHGNDPALLALSTLEILNLDDDFLSIKLNDIAILL
jgi:hypothetical protein